MATVAVLQAVLDANTRGFDSKIRQSEGVMHKAGHAIGVAAAAAGAAIATGLGITAKIGWDEYNQGAKAAAQTNAVLKSTGGIANVTAKQVDTLATSIMKKSGIDDEAVKTGENMLLTFKNIRNEAGAGNDIFNQTTSVLTDMATAMNSGAIPSAEQLSSQSIRLGKALNDPVAGISALTRVGVTFTQGQKDAITAMVDAGNTIGAQRLILHELNTEFAGSAEAAGKTLPGQLAILRERFNNFAGDLVARVIPVVSDFAGFIDKVSSAKNLKVGLRIAFAGVKDAVGGLYKSLRTMLLGSSGQLQPLKLDSGKIIEWERVGASPGLIAAIRQAFLSVPWDVVGHDIATALSTALRTSTEWVGVIIESANEWVDAHTSQIADTGAKILLTIVSTLLDPGFWVRNWKLILGVAIAVIPLGRVAAIGGKLMLFLLRPIERFLGPRLLAVTIKAVQVILEPFSRLPTRIQEFIQQTGRLAERIFTAFVDWLRSHVFQWLSDQLGKVPGWLKAAFRLGFAVVAFNGVKNTIQAVIDKVRDLIGWINDIPRKIGIGISLNDGGLFGKIFGDGVGSLGAALGSYAGAARNPGGLVPQILDDLGLANSMGLVLTSGYRPGAVTSTGNVSLHASGRAIDVAGSEEAMRSFFLREVARASSTGLQEIIHSPYWWHPGVGITRIPASAGSVLADHYNHVHVGTYAKGGVIDRPTMALMGEAGPEMVVPLGTKLHSFVRDHLWPILSKWFHGNMPKLGIGSTSHANHTKAVMSSLTASWLFGSNHALRNAGLKTLIHEIAHTFQKRAVWDARSANDTGGVTGALRWVREGGAEAFANTTSRRVMRALGWGGMDPSTAGFGSWYSKAAHAAWANRGREWIMRKQFSMDSGGYLRPGWNLAYNGLNRPEPVGAGTVYNFNGPVLDGDRLLRFIQNEKQQYERRNGRSPF